MLRLGSTGRLGAQPVFQTYYYYSNFLLQVSDILVTLYTIRYSTENYGTLRYLRLDLIKSQILNGGYHVKKLTGGGFSNCHRVHDRGPYYRSGCNRAGNS
jgi:hypothetical protein